MLVERPEHVAVGEGGGGGRVRDGRHVLRRAVAHRVARRELQRRRGRDLQRDLGVDEHRPPASGGATEGGEDARGHRLATVGESVEPAAPAGRLDGEGAASRQPVVDRPGAVGAEHVDSPEIQELPERRAAHRVLNHVAVVVKAGAPGRRETREPE